MNWTHTGSGLTTTGFLWLAALLVVLITDTTVRVLIPFIVLAAFILMIATIREQRRASRLRKVPGRASAPEGLNTFPPPTPGV